MCLCKLHGRDAEGVGLYFPASIIPMVWQVTHVSELTGSLCLGTIESICATIFPELLREYHRLYPKVNIRLITDSPETLLEMMNSNAIDIVYFLDKRMYDSKWIKVLEEPEDIVFVTASGHPLWGGTAWTWTRS